MKARHLILPLALLSAATAPAALTLGNIISVNFSNTDNVANPTPTGAAVIGAVGNTWNDLQGANGSSISTLGTVGLNLVNGASSGASLNVSAGAFNGGDGSASNLDLYESNVFLDANSQFGPPGPSTITLSGLGAGTLVDLYFYFGNLGGIDQGGSITIGSTTYFATDTTTAKTTYILGDNYVKFDDVAANGSGNIVATWSRYSTQRFSSFAGMQIEAVPEPSSALLGGLGLLALLRRRR